MRKLSNKVRQKFDLSHQYAQLVEDSTTPSEKSRGVNKSTKPDKSTKPNKSTQPEKSTTPDSPQCGNGDRGQPPVAKSKPPTIPRTLRNARQFPRPGRTAGMSGRAPRATDMFVQASPAQALPENLLPLLKVFGLSEHEALPLLEGQAGAYFKSMLETDQTISLDADGQLRMSENLAWNVLMSCPTNELRFKLLAALPSASLVTLISNMEAWRFHDNTNNWAGPATDHQLAGAVVEFNEAYSRAFMDRLGRAREAEGADVGPILDELGLLLEAAPDWLVVDLIKRLREEPQLKSFQTHSSFNACWMAAQKNLDRAEIVQAFRLEMGLSVEQMSQLIAKDPSLPDVICRAKDLVQNGDRLYGKKLDLFAALVKLAPAQAWHYLSSTDARSYLMSHFPQDVKTLLGQIDDLSVANVRAETQALVQSIVTRAEALDGVDNKSLTPILVGWMHVLPPSVGICLVQKLVERFEPARIGAWIESSGDLNKLWQATQSLVASNASAVD